MGVDVLPLGAGRYRVTHGRRSRIAYAVASGGETWVFLDGRVYVLTTQRGSAQLAIAPAEEAMLSAPMPATVVAVQVRAGEQVARGDVMVRLEAMKMELPITAPRNARVRRVVCRAGDLVQPGEPLVELDGLNGQNPSE
jgi:acetyl/propionyl-CoA carboxylase alpha subunit